MKIPTPSSRRWTWLGGDLSLLLFLFDPLLPVVIQRSACCSPYVFHISI